jgi:glycosyltransferase involved in cell wall biosynthesis
MAQFSIVIPCFNAAKTIVETLESIRAQSFTDWEVICVDDGSQDKTDEVVAVAARNDPRIKLVRNTRKGPSAARNLGAIQFATAPIIAFCDADDTWSSTKLAELHIFFADQTVDAAFGQIAFFKDTPLDATVFSTVPSCDVTIPMLLGENPVCTMSNVAVRKHIFVQMQGLNEQLVHNEDLEWLIRLVGQGVRLVGLDTLQVWYRASAKGLSADLPAMAAARQNAVQAAAHFGFEPTAAANAIHNRYLARRALRLGQGRTVALRFVVAGIAQSPRGFFNAPLRGGLTLMGAVTHLFMPAIMSRALFSR